MQELKLHLSLFESGIKAPLLALNTIVEYLTNNLEILDFE